MFRSIDCIQFYVLDLGKALEFYRDRLGHTLVWRSETAAGLRLPGGEGEIVLQSERVGLEVDFLVEDVGDAAAGFVAAGGKLIAGPFEIQIGQAALVSDPWGNRMVLLDMSKGRLVTDADGNIVGNEKS